MVLIQLSVLIFGLINRQTRLFNLGMATNLGEGTFIFLITEFLYVITESFRLRQDARKGQFFNADAWFDFRNWWGTS